MGGRGGERLSGPPVAEQLPWVPLTSTAALHPPALRRGPLTYSAALAPSTPLLCPPPLGGGSFLLAGVTRVMVTQAAT